MLCRNLDCNLCEHYANSNVRYRVWEKRLLASTRASAEWESADASPDVLRTVGRTL
jgi:hypothetical protein